MIYPMNVRYHAALVAAGVQSTYQAHPGGHDLPDFTGELKALLALGPVQARGLRSPHVDQPDRCHLQGALGHRLSVRSPPDAVVTFRQSGRSLSVSAAGSAVTLTPLGGCTFQRRRRRGSRSPATADPGVETVCTTSGRGTFGFVPKHMHFFNSPAGPGGPCRLPHVMHAVLGTVTAQRRPCEEMHACGGRWMARADGPRPVGPLLDRGPARGACEHCSSCRAWRLNRRSPGSPSGPRALGTSTTCWTSGARRPRTPIAPPTVWRPSRR